MTDISKTNHFVKYFSVTEALNEFSNHFFRSGEILNISSFLLEHRNFFQDHPQKSIPLNCISKIGKNV